MAALVRGGLVVRDTLTFREIYDAQSGGLAKVNLRGRVVCTHGVVVIVDKWLRVRRGRGGHYEVLGEFYAYHAYRRGTPPVWLARYDNAHGSDLHRHFFDSGGRETRVEVVTLESLPRLDFIIREAVFLAGGPPLS